MISKRFLSSSAITALLSGVTLVGFNVLGFNTAQAEPNASRINARQQNQQERIKEGSQSGDLTRAEAKRVRMQQRKINRTEQRMTSDNGKLGSAERARLDRMQDRSNQAIKRQKNDAQTRN